MDPRIGGSTLLTLGWLKEDSADSLRAVDQHSHKLAPKFDAYGVRRMGASLGLQSNVGLTDDLENVAAPQDIQLWSLQDAHGFFDDPKVDKIRKAMDSLFSRKEYLWLEVR